MSEDISKISDLNLSKKEREEIINRISGLVNFLILTNQSPEIQYFLKRKYIFLPNHTISFKETNSEKIADTATSAIVDPKNLKNIRFNLDLEEISILFFVRFLNRKLTPYVKTDYRVVGGKDFELLFKFIEK